MEIRDERTDRDLAQGGDTGASEQDCTLIDLLSEILATAQLSRAYLEGLMPDGLGMTQFTVLEHLCGGEDGATPMRIARALVMPKASLTNTLAALARRRLVTMRPDPRDGRGKQVFLTDAGRTTAAQTRARLSHDAQELCAAIAFARGGGAPRAASELRACLGVIRSVIATRHGRRADARAGAGDAAIDTSRSISAAARACEANASRTGSASA